MFSFLVTAISLLSYSTLGYLIYIPNQIMPSLNYYTMVIFQNNATESKLGTLKQVQYSMWMATDVYIDIIFLHTSFFFTKSKSI